MQDLPPADQFDPENPPESVVVLSLGTDTTDLVITNGYRVWQRSVPLGGSHFTKALTKELRLTFAKAEHLKKNAQQAEDPKAVFQAMRPVFNDLLTQIQRSIGFFHQHRSRGQHRPRDRPGQCHAAARACRSTSRRTSGHNVTEVHELSRPGRAGGGRCAAVQGEPAQLRRLLRAGAAGVEPSPSSRPTCCRQKIVTDRMIRDKKPWAVAMVAALLLGLTINFLGHWRAWNSVHPDKFTTGHGAGRFHHRRRRFSRRTNMTRPRGNSRRSTKSAKAWWAMSKAAGCGRKC